MTYGHQLCLRAELADMVTDRQGARERERDGSVMGEWRRWQAVSVQGSGGAVGEAVDGVSVFSNTVLTPFLEELRGVFLHLYFCFW